MTHDMAPAHLVVVLIDIQCGLEKKYETFLNREIRPTLGLFSVILGLFMTKVARYLTHRTKIISTPKKMFFESRVLRVGKSEFPRLPLMAV